MRINYLFLSLLLVGFAHAVNAQTAEERAKIVQEYQAQNPQSKNARQSAENALKQEIIATNLRIQAYLQKHPSQQRTFVKNGSLYFLKDIDADGNPIYINTKNKDSGILIKADQLYTGGTLGVNITGQNMVAGVWDGGQVRATHELLSGKVAMQAGQTLDGSASNYKGNNHQTHVTGTIVGKDIANQPSARGIAFGATALNYDFDSDFPEMVAFAGQGYLISNHSYGGANDNTTPLWKFGAYDREAQKWDSLTRANSYYLPFVAAGNEQQPADNGNNSKNGYDLMTGSAAAKNSMTVGAVNGDKSMSNYSNWGPTDDGRVKPEIVTKGTGINSSYFADKTTNLPSDVAYSGTINSEGTSYAAPAAAAAGLLLQQYYNSLYGSYMKAATLKALMLGTAEDLGQPGPDHKFGWGLLDVEKAARAIQSKSTAANPTVQNYSYPRSALRGSIIEEITYNLPPHILTDPNRKEINRYVYAKGGEPLIISIAWTDTSGVEQTSADGIDPTTSRLVHEYDMLVRITSPFQDSRPWKPSTMANRTDDATVQTGWFDGNGNNYKQIKILNPVAGGQYRIVIRKRDTSPNTLMPVSLVVTGTESAAPTATSPQLFCSGSSPKVANLVATGTNLKWYDASTGGSPLATTTPLVNNTDYFVSQTVDGTESPRTTVRVLVSQSPTNVMASSNSPVTVGSPINLSSSSTGGTSQQWTGPSAYTSANQNPIIASATMANAGIYTVTITSSGTCTATATTNVVVGASCTVTPTPSTQTICSGSPITTVAITGTGTSYSWTRNNTTAVTGIASSGSGDISGSLTNTTEAPITVTFTITAAGGSCSSSSTTTATVVVNPIPTAVASTPTQSICSGASITGITFNNPSASVQLVPDPSTDISPTATNQETTGIGFSSFVAGTVFNWTRDNTTTVTGIAASGSGNISGTLTNTTNSPVTVTFTVTPSYTNAGTTCTGTPITVTVTVNPNPTAFTMTDTGTTLCQGGSSTLSAPANPNYTYAWQRSLSGIASPNSFTTFGGTAQTQVVTTSGVYRAVVTNQYNCSTTDTTAIRFADFIFNGSLATGDATQTGRMNRFGVVSTCATPKSYPGDFTTSGARLYDSYTITNPRNVPVCATIGIRSGCGGNIFSAAYSGSFNPTALATNYLADPGSSFPNTAFYEATIPANGTIVVVVHEVNTGTGCAGYSLSVELPREAAGITVTPNTPICTAGTPVSLTASAANTYLWNPGGATTQSINPSPTATTNYSVTLGYGNRTCSATATTQVVLGLGALSASSNSPVCAGSTLNLQEGTPTAPNFAGVAATSYSWAGPNSFTSSSQNPSISNVTSAAQGVYTLTVSSPGGCTGTATTAVTINALPVPNPSSNSPRDVGTTLTFSSASGMSSYIWAGPNSFTSSMQAPSITNVTSAAQGVYTLTVTNANNCTATATTNVVVNPACIPPTNAMAGSNSPVPVTTPLNLTSSATGAASYAWAGPNGFTSSLQNPRVSSTTTAMTGIYTVTIASAAGSACTATATTAVCIAPRLISGPFINHSRCEGGAITFTSNFNGADPSLNYQWKKGTTIVGTNSNSLVLTNLTAADAGGYSVTATNSCGSASYGPINLTINASPVPNPSSNTPVCAGSTLNLQEGVASFSEAQSNSYRWAGPNSFTSSSQNPSISNVTTAAQGTYTLTVTNTSGCSASATTAVTVNSPIPASASSNSPVCVGSTLNLQEGTPTAPNFAGVAATSYSWAGPNSFSSSSQNPSISNVTTAAQGTYTLTITSPSGCTSTATTAVTINAPIPAFASSNSPVCAGSTLNLQEGGALQLSEFAANSYRWAGPNSFSSSSQNPSISNVTTAAQGTYTLTITSSAGCTSTATTVVVVNPLSVSATNTGPYTVNQTIQLVGTGGNNYSWAGPNGFTAMGAIVNRPNATLNMSGTYTATITNGSCSNTATTNVVVTGFDPCVQLLEYSYVQAGNPYQPLFALSDGMNIAQIPNPTSVIVRPTCNSVTIASVEMNLQGPDGFNWNIIQNVEPFALFDNLGMNVFGRTLAPGNYTLAVTGYSLVNKGGVVSYPKVETRFTITGNLSTVSMPTYTGNEFCAGSSVPVSFTTTGTFNSGNIFKVQLSNENGDFNSPIEIGSSAIAGSVNCLIPLSIPFGENYRIRVISSNAIEQNMNPSPIIVHPYIANLVTPTDDLSTDKNRKAVYQLNATNKVNSPAKVNYQAGNSIQLNPGFEAQSGTVFKAQIGGCN